MNPYRRLVRAVLAWPVDSQQGARRNALVASTALAQLRHEREEVEKFLARLGRPDASLATHETRRQHRDVI